MPLKPEVRPLYKTETWRRARRNARISADDACEVCDEPNGKTFVKTRPIYGELLEGLKVSIIQCGGAHLNGVAGDDRLENVAWLCRACHLRHDLEHHVAAARATRQARKDAQRPLFQFAEAS